jgi:hypothetical protein
METKQLEKAQSEREKLQARLETLRDQCPHKRLELDQNTGETICKDCMLVVGIPPASDASGEDSDDTLEDDELPFHPTTDEEVVRR